ncbi:PAS domain S-box protein [Pseudodesulfovibrio sp.]|uniref:PAS domain S-box protein n=1 Tax=unclassified Pseudodesulfovibrio TaxID=2661612 RepID=UPI003B00C2D8
MEPISISIAERAWLAAHSDMRLGMWMGSPPVMYRGDDGLLQGLVPTYVDLVTAKLGIRPRRVRASGLTAMNGLATAREVDMVAALPTRRVNSENMVLSDPYIFLPIVVVTRGDHRFVDGLSDLTGAVVAVPREGVSVQRLEEDYPELKVRAVDDLAEAMLALKDREADALVAPKPAVTFLAEQLGIVDIRIAAITEYSHSLAMGVRRDWPVLVDLVNRALASISVEERKAIEDYWVVLRQGRWVPQPKVWEMVGAVALVAGVVLCGMLFWMFRLFREVRLGKRNEMALQQSYEATRQILESADVVIVGLDYEGRVCLFNRAGEATTGYSREELEGKNWFDTVVPRERYLFVWDEFNRLMREGMKSRSETFESPIVTKDGEVRQILWRNSSIGSLHGNGAKILSFGTDITHRLEAEEELRLTQFAMDNAALGILRIQPSGNVAYANRTAAKLLGKYRSQLRGMPLKMLGTFPGMDPWPPFWARLVQAQELELEAELEGDRVTPLVVELRLHHFRYKGAEQAICFISDIAERKRVDQLRADVDRMMRHDLRSPTLAVQTMLLLLERRGELTVKQRELLDIASGASKRMLGIIDLSRALYRMEQGIYEPNPVYMDLLTVVSSVAEELGPLLRSRRVTLDVHVGGRPVGQRTAFAIRSEELPCYALLLNLIKNAVEASPEDNVVTLNLKTAEHHIITVHNQGVIPESIRDVFFDKYVTSGKRNGTGLGTYTARLIATSLGGDISFFSSWEQGTTLTVTLPLLRETDS